MTCSKTLQTMGSNTDGWSSFRFPRNTSGIPKHGYNTRRLPVDLLTAPGPVQGPTQGIPGALCAEREATELFSPWNHPSADESVDALTWSLRKWSCSDLEARVHDQTPLGSSFWMDQQWRAAASGRIASASPMRRVHWTWVVKLRVGFIVCLLNDVRIVIRLWAGRSE
jgi:hypothetical protein